MTVDETTHLLQRGDADPDEWEGSTNGSEDDRKGWALWQLGAFCGILVAYSDNSLVWATHETVASQFDKLENSSWIMTFFAIGYCVTLPLYARLSDNYGRLGPLIASYLIFCFGCTLCGFCQTYWQLLVGRAFTGCGASGVISLASIIVTDIAAPSDVAILRSYLNVASTIGLSIGGPLGGVLGETIGWRWSFLGQVPIAICCCVLLARGLQEFQPTANGQGGQEQNVSEDEPKPPALAFDYPGAVTLAIGIASLLSVIDLQNQYSWSDPIVLGLTFAGVSSMIAFLVLETYPGNRELLVPLHLLRTEIGAFCFGQVLIIGSCHGCISQVAPYFANTQGFSDSRAGLQTIPSSIGNALGNLIAGQVIKRFGSYKTLSLVSLFFCIITNLVVLFLWHHTINFWESLAIFPFGLFAGIILSTQFIGLYICSPKQYMATAISMYYMSQQLGIALGVTFCSSLLKRQFKIQLLHKLVNVPHYKEIVRRILVDSSAVASLPEAVRILVSKCYLTSFWVVPTLVIGAQVLALLPMLIPKENPPH